VVGDRQFYVTSSDVANNLQSDSIKSYLLSVFSTGQSIQNSKNKDFGPWRLLPEEAHYLFKNHQTEFYSCADAEDLPRNGSLKNVTPKNSYKVHKFPIKYSKALTAHEIEHVFDECLDMQLYIVYNHFRKLGYYLSSGSKYGMHFLAYGAHPKTVHATYNLKTKSLSNFSKLHWPFSS